MIVVVAVACTRNSNDDSIISPILLINADGTPTEMYSKNASFGSIRNGDGWKGSKEDNRVRSIAVLLILTG